MFERKIINDPVFGFINIPKGLLYDIVRHPLLQRLNRIKQLGLSSVVYPGAQHTRFQHSLGAFHLTSELDCPRCHEPGGIEAFVKDGILAEDGVCDNCGYILPEGTELEEVE